jgi:hypothetical protein
MRGLPAVLVLCACSRGPIGVAPDGDSTGVVPTSSGGGDGDTVGETADGVADVTTGLDTTGAVATTFAGSTTGVSGTESTDTGTTSCVPERPGITVLACGEVDLETRITSDEAFVYAVIDGDIVRVPHQGGELEVLLPDASPRVLVRHEAYLYWVQFLDGTLARLPVDAPEVEVLIEGMPQPSALVVDEGVAYVTTYFDPGAVMRVPTTGEPASVLYGFMQYPGELVRRDDILVFADSNNDGNDSTPILRGTIAGADLEVVDDADGIVTAMLVVGEQLYWALYRVGGSEIRTTPLAPGSAVTTLATTEAQPIGLAVTDERAYWSEIGDAGDHVALRSVSLAGGPITDHLEDIVSVGSLVATADGVVFATHDALARLQ